MIECGIPYNPQDMVEIKEKGCIIDMNNINFPGITEENKVKTAFIYLRNTGFDKVMLDFSKTSKDFKFNFIDMYIQGNIESKDMLLASSVIKIINYMVGINTTASCILSEEEIQEYIESRLEMLGKVLRMIISLPVYLIKRFKINDKGDTFDMSGFESIDEVPIGVNLKHIIQHDGIRFIFQNEYVFGPANYTKVFTLENNELFELLQRTPFGLAMMIVTEEDPDKVLEIINNAKLFEIQDN